ncbi:DUF2637 domain-containing protein [Kitasatospora sp. McL0602]|uniref:DUF2637 domain-containing protein n=1 Tax=Kitasatospora sp. McL0602 TaxID=3439530 RepID=UPI003F8BED8F
MSTAAAPHTAQITGWDRAVVILLGGAGCALSYDALQQMAVAIHVRGPLTYLFPLVIDGFIAYGVRALLVLRAAPLRARFYVWALFAVATAASIWANALHAVRLNEQSTSVAGLRLGDTVVAVLSTLAPLALAGAVHLYILIARGPVNDSDRGGLGQPSNSGQPEYIAVPRTDRAGQHQPQPDQVSTGQPVTALTRSAGQDSDRPRLPLDKQQPDTRTAPGAGTPTANYGPDTTAPTGHREEVSQAPELGGQSDSARPVSAAPVTDRPVTSSPVSDSGTRSVSDREGDPDTEELLEIARTAVRAEDKLTRKVVAQAIRGQKIPLSNDTLSQLMAQLREQHGQPVIGPRP